MKLWKYIQFAGLFVLFPILLLPFLLGGIGIMAIYFKLKSVLDDNPAITIPICFAVLFVASKHIGRGRAVLEEQRRHHQKGDPPVTKMD